MRSESAIARRLSRMPGQPLPSLTIGSRVVVRHLIEDGERATDALGELVAADERTLTVRTRAGEVTVERSQVVVAKQVPETPWRVAAFLRRAGVAVLDLDGVLRTFDAMGDLARAERDLGLPPGALLEQAFGLPSARAMVTGRATRADWVDAVRTHLLAAPDQLPDHDRTVDAAITAMDDDGAPVAATVELVDELREHGIPVFVFTNGTDRVPAELERTGLERLLPGLLNSADLGWAKPAPEAYAVAHAEIERRLGRTVGRAEVRFTDDRPGNVDAAREFGWQARVFSPPPGS